jgi:hypothetical protein
LAIHRRLRVLKDVVQQRVFGSKREEISGDWRKLHDDVLHGLYYSPNIIQVIIQKRIREVWHEAQKGQKCIQDFDGQT